MQSNLRKFNPSARGSMEMLRGKMQVGGNLTQEHINEWNSIMKDYDGKPLIEGTLEHDFLMSQYYNDYNDNDNTKNIIHWSVINFINEAYRSKMYFSRPAISNTAESSVMVNDPTTGNILFNFSFVEAMDEVADIADNKNAGMIAREYPGIQLIPFAGFDINYTKLANERISKQYHADIKRIQYDDDNKSFPFHDDDKEKISVAVKSSVHNYYRGKKQEIYNVDSNGKHEVLLIADTGKCFATGAKNCVKFIADCLDNPRDPRKFEQCKAHFINLKNSDYEAIQDEMARGNVHPRIAIRILKTFGFKKYEEYSDKHHRSIYRIQDASSWLRGHEQKVTAELASDYNLIRFLTLLVEFVNSSPGILNKGFKPEDLKDYEDKINPTFVEKKYMIKRFNPIRPVNHLSSGTKYVQRQYTIDTTPLVNYPSYPIQYDPSQFNTIGVNLVGGAKAQFGGHIIKLFENPNIGSKYLEIELNRAEAYLLTLNKVVDPELIKKIKDEIEKVKAAEDKLVKYINMINEYKRLYHTSSSSDKANPNFLTEKKLKELTRHGEKARTFAQECGTNVLKGIDSLLSIGQNMHDDVMNRTFL